MKRTLVHLLAACACATTALAGGSKPEFLISFHEETDSSEGEKRTQVHEINGQKHWFRVNPAITQFNFKAYWAFPAADGRSFGAVFWLDAGGQHALERIGGSQRGQYLAAACNRQAVDIQVVDGIPQDSRIVIWKGLPPELFVQIDKQKKIRRIGDKVSAATLASRAPAAGTTPAGAPLPEEAVVSRVDPATLEAATADMNLDGKKKSSGKPAAKPAKSKGGGMDFPPFQPDAPPEKVEITPLPEPTRKN